jgi:hypothetical protein
MSIELKIKSKHLALEPAIIRKEEQKIRNQINWLKQHHQIQNANMFDGMFYPYHRQWYNLHHHRKTVVRNESRATHLARAFLNGLNYKQVESKRYDEALYHKAILPRIIDMVAKYGPKELRIHKYYGKDGRSTYKSEEYEALKAKILDWSKLD